MGLLSGLFGDKTTTSNPLWDLQSQHLPGIYDDAKNIYNQGTPGYYPGSTVAGFDPVRAQGLNLGVDAALGPQQQLADTYATQIGGIAAGTDPYTQQLASQAAGATNFGFADAGTLGSARHANAATQAASDTIANRQLQALQQIPQAQQAALTPGQTLSTIGQTTQDYAQRVSDADKARYDYGVNQPFDWLNRYRQVIGTPQAGTERTESPSLFNTITGGISALSGLGIFNQGGEVPQVPTQQTSVRGDYTPVETIDRYAGDWRLPTPSHGWAVVDGRYQYVPVAGGSRPGGGGPVVTNTGGDPVATTPTSPGGPSGPGGPGGTDSNGGLGTSIFGNPSIGDTDNWVNIPDPTQRIQREIRQRDEHGFTTEDVQRARDGLDAGETLEGFTTPGTFQGGADQATQHADMAADQAAWQKAYSNIPIDGTATKEQRVAAAAANSAYNQDLGRAHGERTIQTGDYGPIGITKKAKNLLSDDFYDGSIKNQYHDAAGAATVNAAGIRNIGGSNAQSGDNYGLPLEYQVVGSSDGSSEVWGPDGQTYSSVEEAKAAIPSNEKAKAIADLDKFARSGNASGTQVSQAAYKAGITGADRARLTAQAMASERDSANDKRRAAEAREREATNSKAVFDAIGTQGLSGISNEDAAAKYKEITGGNVNPKDARDALGNLYNTGRKAANEQIADPNLKAIVTGDRGDLKTQLRAAGIRYKKDDSTSKLISKLQAANPELKDQVVKDNYGRIVGANTYNQGGKVLPTLSNFKMKLGV